MVQVKNADGLESEGVAAQRQRIPQGKGPLLDPVNKEMEGTVIRHIGISMGRPEDPAPKDGILADKKSDPAIGEKYHEKGSPVSWNTDGQRYPSSETERPRA